MSPLVVSSGVLLVAGARDAAAILGMADRLGQGIIPAAALTGAAVLGALPTRPRLLAKRHSGV